MSDLTPIDLSDGDRQLSELVRHIEATGEGYLVTEAGRPVARLSPAERGPAAEVATPNQPDASDKLSPEQEAALKSLLSTNWSLGIEKFDRDEVYEDRIEELWRRGQR